MRHRIGFVPQEDILHPLLTTRTALRHAARLRFPTDTSQAERDARIAIVLGQLHLDEHAEKQIANLSGGRRKRVNVALELLSGPDLLILDEPTSGLDPGNERFVMEQLRALADAGRTVIVVSHSTVITDAYGSVANCVIGTAGAVAGQRSTTEVAHFDLTERTDQEVLRLHVATDDANIASNPERPRDMFADHDKLKTTRPTC